MSRPADLARTLLKLARDDAVALETLLGGAAVSDAVIGFHAQQAVEKSLKAALAARGVEFPFKHDLDGLVELCHDAGLEVPDELYMGVPSARFTGLNRPDGSDAPRLARPGDTTMLTTWEMALESGFSR